MQKQKQKSNQKKAGKARFHSSKWMWGEGVDYEVHVYTCMHYIMYALCNLLPLASQDKYM